MTYPYPYLLTSDQHCHSWSAFATHDKRGLNSRLQAILVQMRLAHAALRDRGGNLSVYAGDLFHVRGKIEPSCFNPTFETISALHKEWEDLRTLAIPGNHDLQGREADELGNAMQQLSQIERFYVATKVTLQKVGRDDGVLVCPWEHDLHKFRAWASGLSFSESERAKIDLVIHAPVNGVIRGIPDTGLEARELAALGFRRVFAGHYHDHKELIPGKVWSIGATAHQTWNDPGTKAGFTLVYEDRVEFHESSAPKFVDLTALDIEDEAELEMVVSGNYVRAKIDGLDEAEINAFRRQLADAGALGSVIITTAKKKEVSRSGTTVSASRSLESSVAEYVEKQLKPEHLEEVQKLCGDLLAQARSEA